MNLARALLPRAAATCVTLVLLFGLNVLVSHAADDAEAICNNPTNLIIAENCKPGTDEWLVKNFLHDIEGYAAPYSVAAGETVNFKVNTSSPHFSITIFRSGYYGGRGGRLIETLKDIPGQIQPPCYTDANAGLTSCSNWRTSYSLTIPDSWVSGIYMAKLTRQDTGGEEIILFTVRNDKRASALLFQTSYFTFEAYNMYGGKSVYTTRSDGCPTVSTTARAAKVSLNRPFTGGMHSSVQAQHDMYFTAEYPMVRWLESQGYDVSYFADIDTHKSGKPAAQNKLLDHRVFLVVGHDEYWTQEMRDAVTAARDAGVHLGFFSANVAYWRIRLEADPWTNEPDTVMVTYKTTEDGPEDPTGQFTGTWRDPKGANNPENRLLGVQYIGDNLINFPLRIAAEHGKASIYRHTDIPQMPSGTYFYTENRIIGWEWDAVVDNGYTPAGLRILAETPVQGFLLTDSGNWHNGHIGEATAHVTQYTAPSGALVFASGTILWSWGLGSHGMTVVEPDRFIPQITYNILADMGVQPASPSKDLILDGQSGSITIPESILRRSGTDTKPMISDVQVKVEGKAFTISWKTDVETIGTVWFGTDKNHLVIREHSVDDYSRSHTISEDFSYDTQYYFKISAYSRRAQIAETEILSLKLEPAPWRTQIRLLVNSGLDSLSCWRKTNPTQVIATGGLVGLIVLVAGFGVSRRLWRNRRAGAA